MAQAGIHSMVGLAIQRWAPARKWLMLGIVLGNLFPDADNFAVAVATLTGRPTEGLHRTFTHSLFFVLAVTLVFWGIGRLMKSAQWENLGIGLGIGILMHILLDLVIWFNGVEILWPLPSWVNFWEGVTPPEWWSKLMMPLENLFFVLFFIALAVMARKKNTNIQFLPKLRIWTGVQAALFVIFLVLVFTLETGFITIFGAVYLLSLILAFAITIRMRDTVETLAV